MEHCIEDYPKIKNREKQAETEKFSPVFCAILKKINDKKGEIILKLVEEINLIDDKEMARKINGYALVATVLFYLLFAALSAFIRGTEEAETGFDGLLIGLLLFVALIIIHELIHAVFFKIFNPTGKIKFGFKNGMAYASSPDSIYSKSQFTWIALAPFVLITVNMVSIYSFGWFSRELFTLLTAVHAGACAGDFYYVYLFRSYPDDIKIKDTSVGINIYQD